MDLPVADPHQDPGSYDFSIATAVCDQPAATTGSDKVDVLHRCHAGATTLTDGESDGACGERAGLFA